MPKYLTHLIAVILFSTALQACSSPEEKAADYVANADALLTEGNFTKAEIEYKNALQVNQNQPDAWYGLARIHERKQEWRKAYAVLHKIREMAPNHLDARIMLAQLLLASNQLDQALTDSNEIMEMAPDDVRSHSLMAAVQFRLDNFEGAQQEVDKALKIDPSNPEAILVRARILIGQERFDEALEVLDDAIGKNPDNVSLYLMKIQANANNNDRPGTEKVYRSLIDRFPENNAFKNALARLYLSDNNIDGAESILQKIAESGPENVDEKLRFVSFKSQFRSLDDAIALVKSYIAADEDEYRYRFQLGALYESDKQNEQAIEVYKFVVDKDGLQPSGLEARNKIALLELRAGNREKALALIEEVLAQDINNENALLMQAGFHLGDRRFDDAIVSARTVLRDNPESIKALALLGQAYEADGSSELAIETYTRAFQLNPGTPLVGNQLAAALLRQRKASQADEVLQKSISSGNRSVDALKLMTQVKLSLGEWDQAEKLARQLQKVEGQEAVSQQVLGVVYQGKEQQDDSIDAFKRAHELAPDSVQPVVALVRSYVQSGKVAEARSFLQSILESDSDNINAHLLLGQLNIAEGAVDDAIRDFNRIVEINPGLDTGYRSLATLYARQNDLANAEAILKKGLAAIPDRPILAINLAGVYERRGEFDKAIETYEALLAKNDGLLVAKNNLASLLTDHRTDQASLNKARTIAAEFKSSQIPQFRDTYAWASVKANTNLEEAVVILEGIVKENAQVDVYHYHLGEAYRKKGDSENALAYLNKAAELARPGSDIAVKTKQALDRLK